MKNAYRFLKAAAGLLISFILVFTAGCRYGPAKDTSGFVSAMMINDDTVVFSYKHTVYKPAQGMAAYPDGGIPKYVKDRNFVAAYNMKGKDLQVLVKESNRDWANNQGNFQITHVLYPVAIAVQGGQDRSLKGSLFRATLVNVKTGEAKPLNIESEMSAKGYRVVDKYLADNTGNVVYTANPASAKNQYDNGRLTELWLRTAEGRYIMLAKTWHYEASENGEVIYWLEDTRRFKAYNIATGQTRDLKDFRLPGIQDPSFGVIVSSDRKRLEYGTKAGDRWTYTPLDIPVEKLK